MRLTPLGPSCQPARHAYCDPIFSALRSLSGVRSASIGRLLQEVVGGHTFVMTEVRYWDLAALERTRR